MALDYLTIPGMSAHIKTSHYTSSLLFLATSVDVERVFSKGRIILSHLRNRLSIQSTRVLMCLGVWSVLGYMKDHHLTPVTSLPDLEDSAEEEGVEEGWDMVV
jgi:hypothetical protein